MREGHRERETETETETERGIEKVQGRETKGERETVSILTFCVIKQSQKGWAERDDKMQGRQTEIHFSHMHCKPELT